MKDISLSVIIPVFNETKTLDALLKKVKSSPVVSEIIMVDDYSSDGSREYLENLQDKNVKVVLQPHNQGKGAAVRAGLEQVSGNYTLVQDADLEYDPADYSRLIGSINQEYKVIFGSRFLGKTPTMMAKSFYANKLLTFLTNLLFSSNLTDMASCYKLIPTQMLRDLKLQSNRFELELEITAKLLANKTPIKEIPIYFKGRKYSEGKKIGWVDFFKDLWLMFKYRFFGLN